MNRVSISVVLATAMTVGVALADLSDASAEDCVLATIDGVAVTAGDADAMRALLQPPPPRAAMRRLAVDAALAFWDVHGFLAGSSARGRLDAWRAWLTVGAGEALEALDAQRAAADIAAVASRAGLVPGRCADPDATRSSVATPVARNERGARAALRLQKVQAQRDPRRARLLRVASGAPIEGPTTRDDFDNVAMALCERGIESEVQDIYLPLRAIDRPLALAFGDLQEGGVAGPIRTSHGVYWIAKDPTP